MYGTEWCPHCKNQKALFGKSFQFVDYVDCDINGEACMAADIKSYPTWMIDDVKYSGTRSLAELAYRSGCELAEAK